MCIYISCKAQKLISSLDLGQQVNKLISGDLTILVLITLTNEVSPLLVIELNTTKDIGQLVSGNETIVINIEESEGLVELLLGDQLLLSGGGNDEFGEVDLTRAIDIDFLYNSESFSLSGFSILEHLLVSVDELLSGQDTITIGIQTLEGLLKLLLLVISGHLSGDKGQNSLLQFILGGETGQVGDGSSGQNGVGGVLLDPVVVEGLLSRGSLGGVNSEHSLDELLSIVRDTGPLLLGEVEGTLLDGLDNVGVRLTIEGRVTAKHDIQNDTRRPDIALLIVVLLQDFGSDVVRSTKLLSHLLALNKLSGGTKIYNFNLSILLLAGKQQVLGLQISVDNLSIVAVDNGRQDLLDVISSQLFGEVGKRDDLIEKLTTRAELRNQVIVGGILIQLVEVGNIGVIKLLQNADLEEQSVFSILSDGRLLYGFHGSDYTSVSVGDHVHLTIGTFTEGSADLVELADTTFLKTNKNIGTNLKTIDHFFFFFFW
mmetsp:Transcript_77511/g.107678  ORF Transcript_77511/g.107678 Transcript_77511/m.107678 type:complete len:486 (-) Transcript_77511:62-1519(-)